VLGGEAELRVKVVITCWLLGPVTHISGSDQNKALVYDDWQKKTEVVIENPVSL
jgi:hypothetical protein